MSGFLWAVAGCGFVLLLGGGAYQLGSASANAKWQARWAEQAELQAKTRTAAEASARREEQRRQLAINQVEKDAREQNQVATVDAVDADAAGERVRVTAQQLAAGASRCAADTSTSERSHAASRAAMVLSELLQRADARAGELAKANDRARIAGLACEAAYNALGD